MRKPEFMSADDYDSIDAAEEAAPWAAIIVRVENGYMAFESRRDYKMWVEAGDDE